MLEKCIKFRTCEGNVTEIPIFLTIERLPFFVGELQLVDLQQYDHPLAGTRFRFALREELLPKDEPSTGIDEERDLFIQDWNRNINRRINGESPKFDSLKADTYLYDPLYITDGVTPEPEPEDQFFAALSEIKHSAEQGQYDNFEIALAAKFRIPSRMGDIEWFWAAMRYQQRNSEYTQDRWSHLAVRLDAGYVNKVRFTYPATLPHQWAFASYRIFLRDWHDRLHWTHKAGDDEKWSPEELRPYDKHPELPHELGFFDPYATEQRQRQLAAQYFEDHGQPAAANGPEDPRDEYDFSLTFRHEVAHAAFAELERVMALQLDAGGFGSFVESAQYRAAREGDEDAKIG